MTMREQLRYWVVGTVVFVALLWILADALTPFVLGIAIAYLTDPTADWLERRGFSRIWATILITIVAVSVFVVAILLMAPLLIDQVRQLVTKFPDYVEQIRDLSETWLPEVRIEGTLLNTAAENLRDNVKEWSAALLRSLWSGGVALVNFIAVLFITPVVAFYLLMDWNRMVSGIDDFLPREHRDTIRQVMDELDDVLSGFVRGQLTVCLILGTFYAVGLVLVGLNYGLLIGVFAGLISFIPFVGSILGGLVSVGVAAAQFWGEPQWIAVVAAIFAAGQAVEGNYLTPKLVGDKVGLHPVWLMFALSAFGVVFGFVGLLVAVPAAAAIGVFGRFLIRQYKHGRLYQGSEIWQRARIELEKNAQSGKAMPTAGKTAGKDAGEAGPGPSPSKDRGKA